MPRKKKIGPLKRAVQREFNKMIASGQPCVKCGGLFKVMQCSHLYSIGSYPNLRFDVINVVSMCGRCHNFWYHLEPMESRDWVVKKYPGRYQYLLKAKNKLVQHRIPDLEEIRKFVKDKNMKKLLIAPELLA